MKAANKNNRGTDGGNLGHTNKHKNIVCDNGDGSYHAASNGSQGNKESNKEGNHGKKHSYHWDNFPYYATVEAVDKDYSGIAYNSPTPVLSNNQFWV